MSRWLDRALALPTSPPPSAEPAEPAKPTLGEPERGGFGGFAGFGTRGPHTPEPSPEPAADTPADWRDLLLALPTDRDPCPGFRFGVWPRLQARAADTLDARGEELAACGWTALDLLGVHPVVGTVRPDSTGALLLEVAGAVAAVEPDVIRYAGGLTLRRRPGGPSVPVWSFPAATFPASSPGAPAS